MGQVIPLTIPDTEAAAWDEFTNHAARLVRDHSLMLDRDYMRRHTVLHERWKQLFLAGERA